MKNVKRKNLFWVVCVSFGLVALMLLSFLIQQFGMPICAYAEEQNVPVPRGTFLDMRIA